MRPRPRADGAHAAGDSRKVKAYTGPPMTLGNAAAARVTLIVWCKSCWRRVEPDPSEMGERYDAETTVLDWRERLMLAMRQS